MKESTEMMGVTFNGSVTFNGPMFDIHDNEHVTIVNDRQRQENKEEDESALTTELLLACVAQVREYFWSESSMAVIFCICRDCYGYANNMSQFEREFDCQEGLLSNTFRNNPYMRLPVGKWKQNGVKERVLKLVDAYKNAVEGRLEE